MAEEAAAEASAEEGDESATEETVEKGADATTSKDNKMAKQHKPEKKKKENAVPGKARRKKKRGSIVWAYPRRPALMLSYSPCPHIQYRHSIVRRSKLNQKRYDELLATPKSEPWKEPEEELQMYRWRLITPRTECLAMPPKRAMKAQLEEFSNVLTPQMVENLEVLLKTECELPAEDVSHAKDEDKAKKKKAAKKAKKKKKKQAKKKTAVKKGTGARGAVHPAAGVIKKGKTKDEELEGEEQQATDEEEDEEAEVETEADTEDETEGEEETEVEEEKTEAEGEAEGEVATEEGGEEEGGEVEEEEEGEVEADEGVEEEGGVEAEEGEKQAEAEAAEGKELTESDFKLQETSRPLKEYATWLQESLSKAALWADWIGATVAEAKVKAAKKKGAVLEKDGSPKKLTCKEWNTWKDQLTAKVQDWQSTKQDILKSAKMWEKFMQIRADKIKAGESFTVPNPQAYQKSFGKFSSPRVSKS